MNKPVTVMVDEFRKDIVKTINQSGLHIALVKPIINEVNAMIEQEYSRIAKLEQEQYAKSKEVPEQKEVPK